MEETNKISSMSGDWRAGLRGRGLRQPNQGPIRGHFDQGPGRRQLDQRPGRGHFGHGPGRGGRGRANNNHGEHRGRGEGNSYHGEQQDNNDFRAPQEPRQIRPMNYQRLIELANKEAAEVLLTLRDGNCGFVEMVNAVQIGSDILIVIVRVVALACKSTMHRQNLMAFMTDMLNSKLTGQHLPMYLSRVPNLINIDSKMTFLRNMAVPLKSFLKTALISVPTLATEKLELCVTTFQTTLGTVLQQLPSHVSAEFKDLLEDMEKMRKNILKPYEEAEQKVSQREFIEAGDPPEDFREIQIVPTTAELRGDVDPFLRENIVSGRYRDGEHYLDVQFRLLREDFVGPLREGITKYREIVGAALAGGVAAKALRAMKVLRIYQRVKIQRQESDMVFVLQLDKVLGNINWEISKRLSPGFLLCISCDDFANIALAVVVDRDVKKLKKGKLSVEIIKGRSVVEAPNARRLEYVLAESTVLFESFRPILRGLQGLRGEELPFSKYIIDSDITMAPPKYMRPDTLFDLSPLCELKDKDQKRRRMPPQPKLVPILNYDLWPDKDTFGLDESQFAALQGALTRELAIIQGPPGTGKTFLGLKVVKALIHNKNVWHKRVAPILTICFTNHALDQFLEGILEQVGDRGIMRVGGGSHSEKLQPYNLKSLRQKEKYQKTIPRHIQQTGNHLRWRKKQVSEYMENMKTLLNIFRQRVINEKVLRKFMTEDHYIQLKHLRSIANEKCGTLLWLGGAVTPTDLIMVEQETMHRLDEVAKMMAANNLGQTAQEDKEYVLKEIQRNLEDNFKYMNGGMGLQNEFEDQIQEKQDVHGGEWQVQGRQKIFQKIFEQEMKSMDVMTEREADNVRNLHYLMPRDRWRLYRYWVFKMRDANQQQLELLPPIYEEISRELKEVELEENTHIIRNATVVGMTTTGAAKHQTVLQAIKPQIVIVEEAAEVFEAHIITALTKDCDHLILIGDHQQLRPKPNVYKLASRYNLDVSLFERMIRNGLPFDSLKLQHRMRPQIARLLVPNIYKELLNHPSVEGRPQIKGVGHNVYFINHDKLERNVSDSTSKENHFEADYATALCRHFILQGYKSDKITVLTTYIGQMFQLKNRMTDRLYAGVRITVVDNYQGEENDIIILSLVRSNTESKIGFLKVENRVCVALSRAKNGLFVIGNFDFLVENGSKVWNPIVKHMTKAELIGPTLRLVCQNHCENAVEAKLAADFKAAPEGGCSRLCEMRLPCGHQCSLFCHSYDPEHKTEKTRCAKPCVKIICERGHGCKRLCFDDCGKCNVLVDVDMPRCGHTTKLMCFEDPFEANCNVLIDVDLPSCGHTTKLKCFEDPLKVICNVLVDVDLPRCGHTTKLKCFEDLLKVNCNVLVDVDLPSCGHTTKLRCFEDPSTVNCKVLVDVDLPSCGHKTKLRCFEDPLTAKCLKDCNKIKPCGHKCPATCHDKCPDLCFTLVDVNGPCGHTVQLPCGKKDDMSLAKEWCLARCATALDCGHKCRGSCSKCHQGRFHMRCAERCGRILVCGHECEQPCAVTCPPCTKQCENRCVHSKCPFQCWAPCEPCVEKCQWQCPHYKCTQPCGEPCDRPPCDKPCRLPLPCGHMCIGMCGEPCPKKCRVCHRKEVCEIIFGDEDEEDARFVELEDCGHVIEVNAMDHWMNGDKGKEKHEEINMKRCPKCKTVIRKSLRYGNQVNRILADVTKIKKRIFGLKKNKEDLTKDIKKKCKAAVVFYNTPNIPEMIIKSLERPVISSSEYSVLDNLATLANKIGELYRKANTIPELGNRKTIADHLVEIERWVVGLVPPKISSVKSQHQLDDVVRELTRVSYLVTIFKIPGINHLNEQAKVLYIDVMTLVDSLQPFTPATEADVGKLVEDIGKLQGELRISKEEKIQIVGELGMGPGHWFKCPNGHLYVVGAMQEERCNECNTVICCEIPV